MEPSQPNIYLDVDGVLLAHNLHPANYVHEFLDFVTNNYSTYWLTTHCKGDTQHVVEYLSRILSPKTVHLLNNIKSTNWDLAKTEAIDFSRPFIWFDDYLFNFEKEELLRRNALDSWIEIDLSKNPDQLHTLITHLAE
ncbi:hypothetical protein IPM44_02190 [bacterium]|nr:MAG: hypothetical protein IPM44_02190 [bacterium]